MLEPISEPATLALAPIAATVGLLGRARAGRRRERVNRALHELRRPLAALALAMPAGSAPATGHLERAISALEQLDAELNGGRRAGGPCIVEPERIAADAVARWRPLAERAGRTIELRWRANGSRVRCDPAAVDRALDNLIGNALEHGAGPISVEGAVRGLPPAGLRRRRGGLWPTVGAGTTAGRAAAAARLVASLGPRPAPWPRPAPGSRVRRRARGPVRRLPSRQRRLRGDRAAARRAMSG